MENLWDQAAAEAAIARYAERGISEDLALRTYSARLLGREPRLVLHGGGNTSVKTTARDVFGTPLEVLHIKGSGWDLATIEPAGHPAVRLEPLRRLRALDRLSDEEMVNQQRLNLLDSAAPNPSVEALLHAFLPAKFVDHTHAWAVLALADQPDAAERLAELYQGRLGVVPYVMPGFQLAKLAAEAFEADPAVEGLVLLKHGVFTFGDTAREAYERMIRCVTEAEAAIARRPRPVPNSKPVDPAEAARLLPVLRGALGQAAGERWPRRWILDLRSTPETRAVVDDPRLTDWVERGVATPDHIIRTKRAPMVVPAPLPDGAAANAAVAAYAADYQAYFQRNNARLGGGKTPLDPLPRVLAAPGFGLVGVGKSAAEAAIAADIAEAWASTLLDAEAVGRFEPVGEADSFDMEYWSLEQAKLGKGAEPPLARHVVAVTGAAGAIGLAAAKAFRAQGAEVALLDIDGGALTRAAAEVGGAALPLVTDVTEAQSVRAAFEAIAGRFGGVDIVVSNAGIAPSGMMAELPDETLRRSFELNFFSHQLVAQAAVEVFRRQGLGGVLLFNVSKQALNPGPDFGAYGAAKAALLALVRQYAIEHGAEGVRANAINPDRIRSGLLDEALIGRRAQARRVDPDTYMRGNLLGQEVLAEDVAQAFVFAALMRKTTGAILTVDGGNAAAMVR